MCHKWKGGHVVVQAVSCCPVIAEGRVQLQAYVRYVARFFLEYFSSTLKVSFHQSSILIFINHQKLYAIFGT